MNFTHSTSNKANPTQRHRTLTTTSFFPFHVFFCCLFFKNHFCPNTPSCSLPFPHLAQCTTSHDPRVELSLGLKCHEHFDFAATWDCVPSKEGNSPVNSGAFDRCKRSLALVYTHLNYSLPRTTATNYGWALRIMSLGDLFPVVPGHLLCVHKSCTRIPLSVHNEPVQEGGHVCKVTSGSSPLFPKSCLDCLAPPMGAFLQNLVPFVSHYNATLYVCMHSHVEIPEQPS